MPECPPPHECEDKCVGGYYNCAKIARTMTAPAGRPEDVQEEYLRRCRLGISECLDECAPELPPEYQPGEKRPDCRELCARRHKECLSNGGEPMKCDEDLKYCAGLCAAPPAPEYAPVGARMPSPGEMRGLNPQPEPPSRPLSPEEMRGLNPQPEPPSWFARLMGLFRGG